MVSATTAMGANFHLNASNAIKANVQMNFHYSPFQILIFKCFDPNCQNCTYDEPNLLTGSKICTACATGFTYKADIQQCVSNLCGNGVLNGAEICDSGAGFIG
jgi:hypothetical protein